MPGAEVFKWLILYFVALNVLDFALMGIDKWKAKKRAWRIPEATLFIIAIIGGALGGTIGMHVFHHKTRHWYFLYGMPLIFVLQIALIIFLIKGPIQIITL
ncbi:MAG: DUF1294 domain-containing protein [Lachnospiraceae bacterium]